MKKILKSIIKIFGYKVIHLDSLSKLNNPYLHQKELMKFLNFNEPIIFDVGAHMGETAINYKKIFPQSKLSCFEPSTLASDELIIKMKNFKDVDIYKFAFGSKIGYTDFYENSFGPTNSLLKPHSLANETWGKDVIRETVKVKVKIDTIDNFLNQVEFDRINILKLDTQGSELDILNGALEVINKSLIDLIYLEIILLPTYVGQPGLLNILSFLENCGFSLFNFYDLSLKGNGRLRQLDAIFINKNRFGDI